MHLERFGSEDEIVRAKAEITERASTVFLNVDDPRLAALADRLAGDGGGREVVRCSAVDRTADVCVARGDGTVTVTVAGRGDGDRRPGRRRRAADEPGLRDRASPSGSAWRPSSWPTGSPTVPPIPNRLTSAQAPSGVLVIDDTFNSNPAGAQAALALLAAAPVSRRRVVVTPGMVELGPRQRPENEAFATAACDVATDFVVVGRTNHRALLRGAAPLRPVVVRTREQAVTWVRTHLGSGRRRPLRERPPGQLPLTVPGWACRPLRHPAGDRDHRPGGTSRQPP